MKETSLARMSNLLHALGDYGMVVMLLLLGLFFSLVTLTEQQPTPEVGARELAQRIKANHNTDSVVWIVIRELATDRAFAESLQQELNESGHKQIVQVTGLPRDARQELEAWQQRGDHIDIIAGNEITSNWLVFSNLEETFPGIGSPQIYQPTSYRWPNFLKQDNLLNITNQIAVIAIIAIGMTVVIISGGIDLSVGSLIAFSAVLTCLLIRDWAGSLQAGVSAMVLCSLIAILVSAAIGCITGGLITFFRLPPFIVTLGMMLMASGGAYLLSGGESVYQIPDGFVWLGRGASLLGIPNAVLMMAILYLFAHLAMKRTRWGRYLYAVGGNHEAARLSGVPIGRVRLSAYILSAALAGLGGIIMASQLKSGAPTYGQMYELYVIAAVVVGGTSLSGGEGKILGTLIGAFIIAVIQNGMNLMNIESYTQKVILGLVILLAVLLDRIKQHGFRAH
jgi:ribose transport system permease protein